MENTPSKRSGTGKPEIIPDGDSVEPGKKPDEVFPDEGDLVNPERPAEIEIEREDVDEPGRTPHEVPPETIMPPD